MYSFGLLVLFVVFIFQSSCISIKKITYFNDLPDTATYTINKITPFVDPKIESNDILAITVQTIIPNTSTPITSSSTGSFNELNGFLVDKDGYIELNLIGFVKVGGLTTSEARELLKQKAKYFFKDPIVNVRIANFDVMVLGDVNRAGVINLPSEKASIIDVIGLAGDLQLTANRKNILLIRTEGDAKKFVRFDITSKDIFQSPYFWMKQHDQVYVEPSKYKIQNSDNSFTRNLSIFTSIFSVLTFFLAFKSIK